MRVSMFVFALLLAVIVGVFGAPERSKLQTGPNETEEKQFAEEVVVESILQVRNPKAEGRTGRANAQLNLKDGTRVAEMKRS